MMAPAAVFFHRMADWCGTRKRKVHYRIFAWGRFGVIVMFNRNQPR